MAWMSKEQRESLVKRINKSYGFRKVIITIEMLAILGFFVMTFISYYFGDVKGILDWKWFEEGDKVVLTGLGIGMVVWAAAVLLLGLISLILTYTMKSPKSITKDIKTLESAPIAGRKIKRDETAYDVMQTRTKIDEKKQKKAKK